MTHTPELLVTWFLQEHIQKSDLLNLVLGVGMNTLSAVVSKLLDLKGMTFGRLTVLEKAPSTGGQAEWICKCLCGNMTKVKGQHLRSGAIKSCGCYMRECISRAKTVDLLGQRFGRLVVTEYAGSRNGRAVWRCKCDCGNEVDVFSSYLKTGDTQSCGCLISRQEEYISSFLNSMGIDYERQYTFPDLRGKRYPLRFDFAVFDEEHTIRFLLEYQGTAHFANVFDIPEEDYKYAIERDDMKREYCRTHNIPLYEFDKNTDIKTELMKLCA